MKDQDYYAILQVQPSAEPEVIRAAYRQLARKYHPDRQPPPQRAEAERRLQLINEAYEVLSDAEKRAAYDRRLKWTRELREEMDRERARSAEMDPFAPSGPKPQARAAGSQTQARASSPGPAPPISPGSGGERGGGAPLPLSARLKSGCQRAGQRFLTQTDQAADWCDRKLVQPLARFAGSTAEKLQQRLPRCAACGRVALARGKRCPHCGQPLP
jgi:curved DNA-binding protein CbpA